MHFKNKKTKSLKYRAVRENIQLNNTNAIQILDANNFMTVNAVENKWVEQMAEFKKAQPPFQKRRLKNIQIIVKWWEN